jgi:HlyD family secretion protein
MKIHFDTPQGSAEESNGVSVRYAAAKRQVPRWRWYLLLAAVMALPAYFLLRFLVSYWWETVPGMVQIDQVTLRAETAARIGKIVPEGTPVANGAVLVSLELATTPATAATPGSSTNGRLARAESVERLSGEQLAILQARLRTMQTLHDHGAATRQEVDAARLQELQVLVELGRARANTQDARRPVGVAEPITGNPGTLLAPFDGTIIRTQAKAGEWVPAGAELLILQSNGPAEVQAYLSPDDARFAKVGRQATLCFMDGGRIRAEVVGIVGEAERVPSERVSPVAPRLSSIVVRLKPLEQFPDSYRIHNLPLDVRFDNR